MMAMRATIPTSTNNDNPRVVSALPIVAPSTSLRPITSKTSDQRRQAIVPRYKSPISNITIGGSPIVSSVAGVT